MSEWIVNRYQGNDLIPSARVTAAAVPEPAEPESAEAPTAPAGTFIPLEDLRQRRWGKVLGRPARDLRGQTFGRLKVISRSPTKRGTQAGPQWVCECACGERTVCGSQELREGRKTSCGCQPEPVRPIGRPRIHPRPEPRPEPRAEAEPFVDPCDLAPERAEPFIDPCDVVPGPPVRVTRVYRVRDGKRKTKVSHLRGAAGWRRETKRQREEAAAMAF